MGQNFPDAPAKIVRTRRQNFPNGAAKIPRIDLPKFSEHTGQNFPGPKSAKKHFSSKKLYKNVFCHFLSSENFVQCVQKILAGMFGEFCRRSEYFAGAFGLFLPVCPKIPPPCVR